MNFKIAVLIMLTTGAQPMSAQTYYPFPTDSASWSVEEYLWNSFPGSNGCIAHHYGLAGDTIINSLAYSKLYGNNLPSNFPYYDTAFNLPTAAYVASIREDLSKRVWLREPTDTVDQLYYDFSLNVGDTFCFNYFGQGCQPVTFVDSILIDGNYRRQIHFSPFNMESWIEGIGSTTGWFQWQYTGSWSWQLLCFSENQMQIYGTNYCHCDTYTGLSQSTVSENNFTKLYPNPFSVSTTLELKVDPLNMYIIITDLYGKEIHNQIIKEKKTIISRNGLNPGIYFYRVMHRKNTMKAGKFIVE
jgi:hypothetical protein